MTGDETGGLFMSALPVSEDGMRFEDLPEESWPRHEIIDGSLYVTPLAGVPHQVIATRLTVALACECPPDLQVLAGVNILRRGDTDRLLIPDVAVVRSSAATGDAGAAVAPEDVFMAVEVLSPSTRTVDLSLKKDLYAQWEIGTYWVLDARWRDVHRFGSREWSSGWLGQVDVDSVWPDGTSV